MGGMDMLLPFIFKPDPALVNVREPFHFSTHFDFFINSTFKFGCGLPRCASLQPVVDAGLAQGHAGLH
jgi:hypothetical protein